MTTITIYPLFSNSVNIDNVKKYATDNGFTITGITTNNYDSTTGQNSSIIIVSQILSSAQKTAITTIFQGNAYITFA